MQWFRNFLMKVQGNQKNLYEAGVIPNDRTAEALQIYPDDILYGY